MPTLTGESNFQVPSGYVGILRGFHYVIDPITVEDTDQAYVTVSLIADGIVIPQYSDMILPMMLENMYPVYGISNALNNIGLRITHPARTWAGGVYPVYVYVKLYGNLLLSDGVPTEYQPANRIY